MRATRPLAVGVGLLALLGATVPAYADPTPDKLRAADARIAAARRHVSSLEQQAEFAAEAYNGARVRSQQAAAAARREAGFAALAQQEYAGTLATVRAAQAVANAASARAREAELLRVQALAEAKAAQDLLNRIAIGAFTTGGQLGMVSQLLLAHDPMELASARILMNRVGRYQDKAIAAAQSARQRAEAASTAAHDAQEQATAAVDQAALALTRAATARDKAVAGHRAAAAAAAEAVRATQAAASARAHALALVARAEAALGAAVRSKAQLEAEARAAKNEAAQYQDVDAPSNEAKIAIHWAFQEIGVPYSWGGGDENGPSEGFAQGSGTVGFDCSGLTLFAYGKAGIHLDHYTGSQWGQGQRIRTRGELLPGDLMFFAYDPSNEQTIHHVAIYIGKGKMIEAPHTGDVVRVSSSDRSDFIGATRPWA